jgi:uridine phosphorylase
MNKHNHKYPILEYDESKDALIKPENFFGHLKLPQHCIMTSLNKALKTLEKDYKKFSQIGKLRINGSPVYQVEYKNTKLAVISLPIGAPLAAGVLEEVITCGVKKVIVSGTAGVLDKNILPGEIIIPDSTIRDEGISYHYIHPDKECRPNTDAYNAIISSCKENNISFQAGKTWTTDAFLRETPKKIKNRKEQGCLTVEMEAASLFAVAEFRDIQLGQILYGLDDISSDIWDPRFSSKPVNSQQSALKLAIEACIKL